MPKFTSFVSCFHIFTLTIAAEVPAGYFKQDSKAFFCPIGSYQNQSGSSACKLCPSGSTTLGIGSESEDECILGK